MTLFKGKYALSSEAFALCICETNSTGFDCTESIHITTLRGSMFNVCAITALAEVHKTARLKLDQNSQQIEPNCSTLSYNMYPTKDTEQLVLFPDKTCRDTGFAVVTVNVTFDDCPVGFMLSGDQCSCDKRLQKFTHQCIVGNHNHYITRKFDSRFWIGYSTSSTLGIGLTI